MPQMSLFAPGQGADPAALELAPQPTDVTALAARLPRGLRLGGMSWNYPGWIGPLYSSSMKPSRLTAEGLAVYARHPLLRAMEIDRTFYAPISAASYAALAAQVGTDFRFTAKAHEDCTAGRFPARLRGSGWNSRNNSSTAFRSGPSTP